MMIHIDRLPIVGSFYGQIRRWVTKNSQNVVRLLTVIFVLLASAVIGRNPSLLFLLPLVAAVGGLIIIRWQPLGLLAIIGSSLVIPFAIGTGTGSSINPPMMIIVGMFGLWLLDMVAKEKEIRFINSRTLLPLAILLVVTVISFLVGQLPWFAVVEGASIVSQVGGVMLFALSALAYAWVGHKIHDLRWLKAAVWLFLGLGAIFMFTRILPPLKPIQRLYHPGVQAGSLFWTWMVAMAFSQLALNRRLPLPVRVGIGGILVITIFVAFVQSNGWKSGWVPPLIGMATIVALRWPRAGLLLLLFGAFPAYLLGMDLIASDAYSYSTRLDAWFLMAEIVKVNPILGMGPSNYYFYTPLFAIRGYSVQFNSHNQYVDIIAQIGLLGLAFFIWFSIEVSLLGWRLRTKIPKSGFTEAYVYGSLGGWVATLAAGMLGDWVIPFVYNVGFNGFRASVFAWLFVGGLLAIQQMVAHSKEDIASVDGGVL